MIALGIGCFWFGAKGVSDDASVENFSPRAHVAKIKHALESVDNISEVVIDGAGDDLWPVTFAEEDEENFFFPMYGHLSIRFGIYLQKRVQERYSHGWRTDEVERFNVEVKYSLEMPVAYVHYDAPAGYDPMEGQPSHAISVIRNYLEEKLKNDPDVVFRFLGPSPFHADFFLSNKAAPTGFIKEVDLMPGWEGYKQIKMEIGVQNAKDMFEKFQADYHATFSSFYSLMGHRNMSLDKEIQVLNGADTLFRPSDGWRLVKSFRNKSVDRETINNVYKLILEDRRNRMGMLEFMSKRVDEGSIRKEGILGPFFREFESEPVNVPWEEVREVLQMFEERTRLYYGNAITVVAALASAILGAVIGSWLTYEFALHDPPARPTKVGSLISPTCRVGPETLGPSGVLGSQRACRPNSLEAAAVLGSQRSPAGFHAQITTAISETGSTLSSQPS